ncbi:MAG TPA: ribulokinase [Polyangia bacterium]|nr:ribulokinase [Polyangia bacterium]
MATRAAPAFTIGVDFGTSSARAVVIDVADGAALGTSVFDYPSGKGGVLLDDHDIHLARQNPGDYLAGLRASITGALAAAETADAGAGQAARGFTRQRVIGVGVDTTGSTPLPVDAACRPLALDPRFAGRAAAQAWLWKDHTGAAEAAAITEAARRHAPQYLAPIGGTYSSEWFWSKIWRCLRDDPEVFGAAASWVELCDYIPAVLAGASDPRAIRRSVCAAGHKAMFSRAWGGLPSADFLARLDPRLGELRSRLYREADVSSGDRAAGALGAEWSQRLGLPEGIAVALGGFDAHLGAVGAGIRAGTLVKIIGTSTCDIAIAPAAGATSPGDIPGICGIVDGSVMPGYLGIEAGQSAVGDLLEWWAAGAGSAGAPAGGDAHVALTAAAARLAPGQSGLVALDWNNGNRTVLVDPRLTGLLVGQTLHTTRAEIYRALIEATAFGARAIIDRLRERGVPIERVVCCGGIAEKNDLFMQIYADVLARPMAIAGSSQTPALGAALAAAVAAGPGAGGYATFEAAQARMTQPGARRFDPRPQAVAVYERLYGIYRELHDLFGGVAHAPGTPGAPDAATLMKRLLALREEQVSP